MKELTLTRVGEHHMDGGLYKDEKGRFYVDCHDEVKSGQECTVYRLSPSTEPDGEPCDIVTCITHLTNPPTEREMREKAFKFDYMMLDRMRSDCEYYDTAAHYNNAHFSTIDKTIADMKARWQKLPEDLKPEWLSWEKILEYEKKFGLNG